MDMVRDKTEINISKTDISKPQIAIEMCVHVYIKTQTQHLAVMLYRDLLEGKASECKCRRPRYEPGSEFRRRQTQMTSTSCEIVSECGYIAVNLQCTKSRDSVK